MRNPYSLVTRFESAERALGTESIPTNATKNAIAKRDVKSPRVIRMNANSIARPTTSKCDGRDKAGIPSHYHRGASERPETGRLLDRVGEPHTDAVREALGLLCTDR